jgi:hypothetical protein
MEPVRQRRSSGADVSEHRDGYACFNGCAASAAGIDRRKPEKMRVRLKHGE